MTTELDHVKRSLKLEQDAHDTTLKRLKHVTEGAQRENDDVCQTLGKALGYPWFKDDQENFPGATEAEGVCVGDHVAASMAAEAAAHIRKLTNARDVLGADASAWKNRHSEVIDDYLELRKELHETRADYEAELNRANLRADELQAAYLDALDALQGMTNAFGASGGRGADALSRAYATIELYLRNHAPKVPTKPKPGDVLFECTADAALGSKYDFLSKHIGEVLRLDFESGSIAGKLFSVGSKYVRVGTTETIEVRLWHDLIRVVKC